MTDQQSNNLTNHIVVSGLKTLHVFCPKHGTHPHVISSSIEGYEGAWCQICWLESLGSALHSEMRDYSPEVKK